MPQPTRGQQLATSGLGLAFSSPVKRSDKRKTTAYVVPLGQDTKRRRLEEKLRALQSGHCLAKSEGSEVNIQAAEAQEEASDHMNELPGPGLVPDDDLPLQSNSPKSRRVLPDKSAHSLFAKWSQVIPGLISPYLSYVAASTAAVTRPPSSLQSVCLRACEGKSSTILCLFQDRELLFLSLWFLLHTIILSPIRLSQI
jgi:hypothetical protein